MSSAGATYAVFSELAAGAATPAYQHSAFDHVPSWPTNFEGNHMEHSLDLKRRNFHRRTGRTLQQRYSTRDVTHAVSNALADLQAKEVAEAAGSSVRAAENAKQGMNAMSLAHFLNACREIPELRAVAMEMMGVEPVNPDRERALAMLVNSYVRGDR